MKVVYKVKLPCGHFYIGCTKQDLKIRLYAHLHNPYTNKFADFIKEKGLCLDELLDFTTIIHEGKGSAYHEQAEIFKERNNSLMLNTRIMKNEPKPEIGKIKKPTKQREDIVYKHIAVSQETKQRFDDLRRIKGMTQDGLIRLLMERV